MNAFQWDAHHPLFTARGGDLPDRDPHPQTETPWTETPLDRDRDPPV